MRSHAILSSVLLVALTGCASSTPAENWRAIQQQRLERLHAARSLDAALDHVMSRAPARHAAPAAAVANAVAAAPVPAAVQNPAASQDPKHLDQRLPPLPGHGPRQFRHSWQPLVATIDVGAGNVAARIDGTRLDDRTDAWFARARLDTASGAALHAETWSGDDDLFQGRFISDGTAPAPASAELSGIDLYPHKRFDNQWGDVSMPVRVGLFTDWQRLDSQSAQIERDFLSFGPRVVIEPTWRFLGDDDGNLELFTRLGGDIGPAWFTERHRRGNDRDVTARWAGELSGGLRAAYGPVHAEVGYRVNHTTYGQIDADLYGDRDRTELQRQQIFVGFGFTY